MARSDFHYTIGTDDFLYEPVLRSILAYSSAGIGVTAEHLADVAHCDYRTAEKIRDYWQFKAVELGFIDGETPPNLPLGQTTSDCVPDNTSNVPVICHEQVVAGHVDQEDRTNLYKVWVAVDQTLSVAMYGTGGDADLFLYAPEALFYADSSEREFNNEFMQGQVLTEGYWQIQVNSYEGSTDYRLIVTVTLP